MMDKKFSHGGARPGAGRKAAAVKRVILSCRVHPATKSHIQEIAADMGTGIGNVLDLLLQERK